MGGKRSNLLLIESVVTLAPRTALCRSRANFFVFQSVFPCVRVRGDGRLEVW